MLTKDSFPLSHFFMLLNTGKHGKPSLHQVFYWNKQSVLFFFLLFLFLFSFPLPGQILPSWIFFLPTLLLWSLYFVDGNILVVAGGSTIFDRMIGFNNNIVVEFWTLASVIGLRLFGFSWVSLWKRWSFSFWFSWQPNTE